MKRPLSSSPPAFSLVEILSVLAILSILLAISLPAFSSFNNSLGFKKNINNFFMLFDEARIMAITGGGEKRVVLKLDRSGGRAAIFDARSDNQLSRWFDIGEFNGPEEIVFSKTGSIAAPIDPGSLIITIFNSKNIDQVAVIEIRRFVGRASLSYLGD